MIKSVSLKAAVRDTIRIFQFEQWIRFYYIKGEGDALCVEIPDEIMKRVEEEYPSLKSLAETMTGSIDYKKSHEIVCAHVASHLDGTKYDMTVMPKVFDSPQFKIEMYVFNMWMKMHEPYLEEEIMFFSDWEEMWEEWNKLEEVQQYREKLINSGQTPTTVQ